MNIILLRRFVAVAEELHFPRAADALDIPLASLYSSIEKLETEVGHPLFTRHGETQLTKFGILFLPEAREEIAAAPAPAEKPVGEGRRQGEGLEGQGPCPHREGEAEAVQEAPGALTTIGPSHRSRVGCSCSRRARTARVADPRPNTRRARRRARRHRPGVLRACRAESARRGTARSAPSMNSGTMSRPSTATP